MKVCRKLTEDLCRVPIILDKKVQVSKSDKIFSMGGCFNIDMASCLKDKGYNIVNTDCPTEPRMIWYNTYTILYEFQRIVGDFVQDGNDVWSTKNGWQDPYRRLVYEETKDKLTAKIKEIDNYIRNCILEADFILMSLSLTEVFFFNGKAMSAVPGYGRGGMNGKYFVGGGQGADFRFTGYEENVDNVRKILNIIGQINKKCKVLFVAPITPIGQTFTDMDHLVANAEGSSILRSVIGTVCREFDNACYFPAYELCLNVDRAAIFVSDGRHMKKEFVEIIMGNFERLFS